MLSFHDLKVLYIPEHITYRVSYIVSVYGQNLQQTDCHDALSALITVTPVMAIIDTKHLYIRVIDTTYCV